MTAGEFFDIVSLMDSILIVDDQAVFRRRLRELLHHAGLKCVLEAGDIPAAVDLAQSAQPDLALVDVMLPGVSGVDGVQRLKRAAPCMRIVLVSAYHDAFELFQESARAVGAEAFVAKDELDFEMIERLMAPPVDRKES